MNNLNRGLLLTIFLLVGVFVNNSNASENLDTNIEKTKDIEDDYYSVSSIFHRLVDNSVKTWKEPDYHSIFVPVRTWHNRIAYDKKKVKEYNEEPWGIGFGLTRYDEDDDMHAVFAMIFKDSNFYQQTIFGYAYQKNYWFGDAKDWFAGYGLVASLTQRHEYSYIPVPLPIPMVGIGHRNVSLQMAYVPGVKNNGNVAFAWVKIDF